MSPSKMPKAKTITRKDNPDKVKMYAEGGKANWIKDAIKKPGALRASLGAKKGEPIPAKKLAAAEKVLQKCEPGYEEQIKTIFSDRRKISAARVISLGNNVIFVDAPTVFDSVIEAMRKMSISSNDIRKAVEHNNGIHRGFYWSYE